MRVPAALPAVGAIAAVLAACNLPGDVGYVEIRTVPASAASAPPLYLDTVKLEPFRKGSTVLTQRVGTAKLAAEFGGGHLAALCEIVIRKNRITTVTVSVLERPPRCQCQNGGAADPSRGRLCVS